MADIGNGVEITRGQTTLRATGLVAALLLCTVGTVAAMIHQTDKLEASINQQHMEQLRQQERITRALNRNACVSLYNFNEREYFRKKISESLGAVDPFKAMCPWMAEDDTPR